MEKFLKSLPPPPPKMHVFLISMTLYSYKKLARQMGTCISGGGGAMSYTSFDTWGRGDKGDKILKCYTFELFTLSINIL